MKALPCINENDEQFAIKHLKKLYDENIIVSEKKPYLTDLRESVGPYMAIQNETGTPHYLMDVSSQIATLGLGFSPLSIFGTSHFLESWTNNSKSELFLKVKDSLKSFLSRMAKCKDYKLYMAHSGAEANETALGMCYHQRKSSKAKKVLAFEGSFHGRMMVSLSATWNKAKREPFEWPDYEVEYCPYPDTPDGKIHQDFPENWRETWENSPRKDFLIPKSWTKDFLLKKEIDVLNLVRKKLISGKIYAILIEPMQCEGGDRYSTDRFHNALIILAKSFDVPLVYDEVQTGLHLSKNFFWHTKFNLKDSQNNFLHPDYIVCAKKAQLGLVLSLREQKSCDEEFHVASLIKGLIHAISLDQSSEKIEKIENNVKEKLHKMIQNFSTFLENPRIEGLAFSFDFKDPSFIPIFIEKRFTQGLLFYPAGDNTLRFRLNTSFREEDLEELFKRLQNLCSHIFEKNSLEEMPFFKTTWESPKKIYGLHSLILSYQLKILRAQKIDLKEISTQVKALFFHNYEMDIMELNSLNFSTYKEKIERLQKKTYEPTRQTSISKLEEVACSETGIALLLLKNGEIVGHTFSSCLKENPYERGVRRDPHFSSCYGQYVVDTTISSDYKGQGLGIFLRSSTYLYAMAKGIHYISGRNRDKVASSMMLINLSLGAFIQEHLAEDYLDELPHRDVLYYKQKAIWSLPIFSLSSGVKSPLGIKSLKDDYINKAIPYLINKVCLSNFVSSNFLENLSYFSSHLPKELRHLYTTNGQSECIDKIAKTLWFHQEQDRKSYKVISFKDHYFGPGSFLSRELGNKEKYYFSKKVFDHPTPKNSKKILKDIELALKKECFLGIFIEPILQKLMIKTPLDFLKDLRALCDQYKTPLIFNETYSSKFHYESSNYFLSSLISPDIGMCYLGGQMGIVFCKERYYLKKPLMMISTWDGDEFSLMSYIEEMKNIMNNPSEYVETQSQFSAALKIDMEKYFIKDWNIHNGFGFFKGNIPLFYQNVFDQNLEGAFLVCPNYNSMKSYLEHRKYQKED